MLSSVLRSSRAVRVRHRDHARIRPPARNGRVDHGPSSKLEALENECTTPSSRSMFDAIRELMAPPSSATKRSSASSASERGYVELTPGAPSASSPAPRCPRSWSSARRRSARRAGARRRDGLYGRRASSRRPRKAGVRPLVGAAVTWPTARGSGSWSRRAPGTGTSAACSPRASSRRRRGRPRAALGGPGGRDARALLPRRRRRGAARRRRGRGPAGAAARRSTAWPACSAAAVDVDLQRHGDARRASGWTRRLADLAADRACRWWRPTTCATRRPPSGALLDVLTCIRHKHDARRGRPAPRPNAERCLKPPAEMAALFADLPGRDRGDRAVAERCEFTLADLGYRFPDLPAAAAARRRRATCASSTEAGARERYRPLTERVRRQLEHELRPHREARPRRLLPHRLGHRPLLPRARHPVQGRGSAANSASATRSASPRSTRSAWSCSSSASSPRSAASGRTSTSTCRAATGARRHPVRLPSATARAARR